MELFIAFSNFISFYLTLLKYAKGTVIRELANAKLKFDTTDNEISVAELEKLVYEKQVPLVFIRSNASQQHQMTVNGY